MTPEQLKKARQTLGLSISQMALILNVTERTLRRYEETDPSKQQRPPHPSSVRIIEWMLDGYRPEQWPSGL